MSAYAELAVTTNFSFLRGASHPREMVETADELGQIAIGIADRNSFAGVVRAYDEAKNRHIKLMVGTRLVTTDGFEVLAYPTDRAAYGRLCRLLTAGNLAAKKGECHLTFEQILGASEGQMLIAIPPVDLFSVRHPGCPRLARASKDASETLGRRPSRLASLAPQGDGNEASPSRREVKQFPHNPSVRPREGGDPDWIPAFAGMSGLKPASPPSSRRHRGVRFSPAFIIIAATSRAGSVCWPSSAKRAARRSLR